MSSPSDVAECLLGTLNVDPNVRMAAELKLAQVMTLQDISVAFSHLLLSQDAAGTSLRKYVAERWSPHFSSFKGTPPPPEIKANVRQNLFQGLSDPISKIRSSSAHTLSLIASSDWPDAYPELLPNLIALLSSNSPNAVHGGMQVLLELVKSEMTEDQLLPVLRELVPILLTILGSPANSATTRARTVSVFQECVTALYMVKEQFPQAAKDAASTVIPVWLDAFKVLLSSDPTQDIADPNNWDALAIKIAIYRALSVINVSFGRTVAPYLVDYLDASVVHLQSLFPTFQASYIKGTVTPPEPSEGEPAGLQQLASSIMDFIVVAARSGKVTPWLETGGYQNLTTAVFNWVQMTKEDEVEWADSANAFTAQEDEDSQSYTLRQASLDLLACLVERSALSMTKTLNGVLRHVVDESSKAREAGNPDWWRSLEAAFVAVGGQSEDILEAMEDEESEGRPKPMDIEYILSDIIPSLLSLSECPFLQGRSFVFASQFAKLLPAELGNQYLTVAIEVIEAPQGNIPIKVSAVKAVENFCNGDLDPAVTGPFAPRLTRTLGPFLLATSEDTLNLVMDTLAKVLELEDGSWLTPDLATALSQALLEVWSKNSKDPVMISVLDDIFGKMAKSRSPGVYEAVVKESLPRLCHAVANASPDEWHVAGSALDLVSSLLEGAEDGSIGDGLFGLLAPGLFACMRTTEDRDVLQNGVRCLTLVIRKEPSQLISWTDPNGQTGISSVLAFLAKLLNSEDESGGLVIGDLIIHLLRRAGDAILPVLQELLQAMVTRMTSAKTTTFTQSLLIPFCFLIHTQRDSVLALLESTNFENRSGLDIFIQTWCENAETFQGFWPSRVSNLAFCACYASERPSLQNLVVKGDMIVKPETKNVIVTRSKAKQTPHEFTAVPFPVKAIKLLLKDLQTSGEAATMAAHSGIPDFEVESDSDEDDEWADEDKVHDEVKKEEFNFLSDLLGPRGSVFDNDDILAHNDDLDLRNDPVSQMDMKAHLISFFRECAARNTGNFTAVGDQLSAEELLVIRRVLQE